MAENIDRSGFGHEDEEAPRESLPSDATPQESGEGPSSEQWDDNPVLRESATPGSPVVSPWSEVMKDFARLVISAYKADPHRFG